MLTQENPSVPPTLTNDDKKKVASVCAYPIIHSTHSSTTYWLLSGERVARSQHIAAHFSLLEVLIEVWRAIGEEIRHFARQNKYSMLRTQKGMSDQQ